MKRNRTNAQAAQTVFLLVLAAVIGYLWKQHVYFLYPALLLSVGGFLSPSFVLFVDKIWMKLGWLLGQIIPRLLLSFIFYFILTPLALLSKVLGEKDPLQLRKPTNSLFKEASSFNTKESFKKMW
jgi:hypothetical protein